MICFVVQAHHQPAHHERLVRTLVADGDVVVTHVNASADQSRFAAVPGSSFTAERVDVHWRGFSQVEATLVLLRTARERHPDASHYWFISGDSYPVRSPGALRDMLEADPERQLINIMPFPAPEMGKPENRLSGIWIEHDPRGARRTTTFFRVLHRITRRPWRRALDGRQPFCGSNWFTLTAGAVDAVLRLSDDRAAFRAFCGRTVCADEHYFHTLLGETRFLRSTAPAGMFADFTSPQGPWPSQLTEEHVERLVGQVPSDARDGCGRSGSYFARKFTDDTSDALTAAIRERLWPLPIAAPARNPVIDAYVDRQTEGFPLV
ncbi:beta-1,6-N-acetylglucosaminyltransferase [Curtobacterium sp. L1-20]|uniref:beta-1,6-N-acetylglucosaminyltransferase n=1 Tax=Curtobacterium sp. L1-20 TaxID=3138181 RepID=UPI003B527989